MRSLVILLLLSILWGCNSPENSESNKVVPASEGSDSVFVKEIDTLRYPEEGHLRNLRQLTFGGDNAEAYFSFDSKKITFQSNYEKWGLDCDQIFYFDLSKGEMKDNIPPMISNGDGRTTCAYFLPGDTLIVFASTHHHDTECPPVPEHRTDGKYVWPVYKSYDIFVANLEGKIINKLTNREGYDAEATVSPLGDKIVFTSDRSGDLELWTMDIDGSNKKQITSGLGYDGGAFFSPDGKKLVFRSSRPGTPEEKEEYKNLLKQGLVTPTEMEIYTCNTDGSDLKQVTNLGKANWAPFFHPSGEKIIFSSNHKYERGFRFNLFMTDLEGNSIEQITFDPVFDAFPMFSFDGKYLIFSSNRNNGGTRATNIFLAEWVEGKTITGEKELSKEKQVN